jgi:signal transduction histidine kinase/CheY-like chemotaxis protein
MTFPRAEFANAAQAARQSVSTYRLTLDGLLSNLPFQIAFNALAALSMLLLGHPLTAGVVLASCCAADLVHRGLITRWMRAADADDEQRGFTRIAILSGLRFCIYVAPTLVEALRGGMAEMLVYALQAAVLISVAHQAGSMARRVFWAFVTPVLAGLAAIALVKLPQPAAAGALISLFTLTAVLGVILEGTYRTIQVLHVAFNDNVAMIPQLEAARDQAVAERAAADGAREEAREASRAKAAFLATMSHEIRTPMNGVLGMAQLMKRDETNPEQARRLEVLIESGEYLLSILNDILDVSKIDAGRLDIMPRAEDLHLFLERLVSFWGAQADEKGVALVLDLSASTPHYVLIDALRLRQVLFNLVGNALKFTEHGAVEISARATPVVDGAVRLHLAVKDSGIGIAAHNLPHLFDRFRQADDTEARRFGGTGLGLAIAKQLIELMGGTIRAESVMGQGSTFHIELPLAVAEAPAAPVAAADPPDEEPRAALKVLAVDDNAVNLLVLDQLLAGLGHVVVRAGSGREALALLAEEVFDLVLLDIQMPEMSGIEALARLRGEDGPNRLAPVVALTADVMSGGPERYLAMGFTAHAAKPIQIRELAEAMARAVAADERVSLPSGEGRAA